MTILEAIDTAIQNLEGVRLPIRDSGNANRVAAALGLLDAVKASLQAAEQKDQNATEEGPQ